jgi:hypothetical protein
MDTVMEFGERTVDLEEPQRGKLQSAPFQAMQDRADQPALYRIRLWNAVYCTHS